MTAADRDAATDTSTLVRGISMVGGLSGGANVIMQLSRPGVGYGVVESKVDRGNLYKHPIRRARTTLTYLAVAVLGNPEEKSAYRRAVNGAHVHVRSGPDSPVHYNAFDKDLQLWVAACLYRGLEDVYRIVHGPLGPLEDDFYQQGAVFGTTLQLPSGSWPADRAAFEEYWNTALAEATVDDTVREYLRGIADVTFLLWPLRVFFGPVNRFFTVGFLPQHFREQMHMSWTPRHQQLFDTATRALAVADKLSPPIVRQLPFHLALWDLRRRMRRGAELI